MRVVFVACRLLHMSHGDEEFRYSRCEPITMGHGITRPLFPRSAIRKERAAASPEKSEGTVRVPRRAAEGGLQFLLARERPRLGL